MKNESCVEFFGERYFMRANVVNNSIDVTIIEMNNENLKKFVCKIGIGNDGSKLCVFDDCYQLLHMFQNTENYIYESNLCVFTLKWKIVCQGYSKQIFCDFNLQASQMTEMEELKLENYMLKKKLSNFEVNYASKIDLETNFPPIQVSKTIQKVQQSEEKINAQQVDNQDSNKIIDQIQEHQKTFEITSENNCKSKDSSKPIILTKTKKTKQIKKEKEKDAQFKPNKPNKGKQKSSLNVEGVKSNQVPLDCEQVKASSKQINHNPPSEKVKISFANGDYYYGELQNNIYHGSGLYFSSTNGTFDGNWENGKANGFGVSRDPSGNKHSGYYTNDKRNGHGIDEYINGQRYQGNFLNDSKDGFGKYVYKNGDYFEGMWKNDLYHGTGKESYVDGSIYEGTWCEDEKDGKGIFTNEKNKKFEQLWQKGIKISEKPLA